MNDKLSELAERAGFMDSWFSESGDDCEQELRKFAELIVKECVLTLDYQKCNYGVIDMEKRDE